MVKSEYVLAEDSSSVPRIPPITPASGDLAFSSGSQVLTCVCVGGCIHVCVHMCNP